jgi:hypothetical protein
MGMTIDKAILRVEHSSMSVDDKETADFIINTMRKYQKIQKIANDKNINGDLLRMSEIRWVLEDKNDD